MPDGHHPAEAGGMSTAEGRPVRVTLSANEITELHYTSMLTVIAERRRSFNALGFAGVVALLAAAYYLQYVEQLEPCPLCIFQRMALFAVAVVFLIALLHGPRRGGSRVYAGLVALTASLGAAIAIRHLWLQSLPADQVPACGPGLDYMLDVMPLWETVRTVLQGSGECAEVDPILGLSIPVWTLAAFIGFGLYGVAVNWPRRR